MISHTYPVSARDQMHLDPYSDTAVIGAALNPDLY
jgi:hypothetical protein